MPLVVLQGQPNAPLQQRAHALHETFPAARHDLRPLERHRKGNGEEPLVVEAVRAVGTRDDRACRVEVRLQLLHKVQLRGVEGQDNRLVEGRSIGCIQRELRKRSAKSWRGVRKHSGSKETARGNKKSHHDSELNKKSANLALLLLCHDV